MESNSAEVQGAHDTTPLLLRPPSQGKTPPVELTALSTADNVRHILPGLVDLPPVDDATVLSTTPEGEAPKDWLTGQAINPIETVAPIVPTVALVVKLTSPIITSNQTKEERWYMLVVTALVRRLNLEATRVVLRDTVTTLLEELPFRIPRWQQFCHDLLEGEG